MPTALTARVARLRRDVAASARPGMSAPAGGSGQSAPSVGPPTERLLAEAAWSGDPATGVGFLTRVSWHRLDELAGFHSALAAPGILATELARHSEFVGLRPRATTPAERVLFLDLETTGLRGSGTLAWCLGLASVGLHEGRAALRVEQVLLESPDAEAEALARVLSRLESADVVVTFNGRSFDLPLLESRCVLQRRSPPPRRPDVDLLAPARRLFAGGDATLVAVEERLGRGRVDDLPGAQVPRAWFDWLRHGEPGALRRAVEHNREDLLAMAAVLSWILAVAMGHRDAEALASPVGHAEMLARLGRKEAALSRLEKAGLLPGEQGRRRARLLHVLAGRRSAGDQWQRLIDEGESSPEPWEGIAKILEHDERDFPRAADLVVRALRRVGSEAGRRRLADRLERLLARIDGRPAGGRQRVVPPAAPGLVDCPRFPESAWKSSLSDILSARSSRSARS